MKNWDGEFIYLTINIYLKVLLEKLINLLLLEKNYYILLIRKKLIEM